MRGLGVPQDDSEAVRWYRKAADQGKVEAETHLGQMYSEGQGVTQNYAEAVKWYRLAAEQGDPDAQHDLGLAYEEGEGIAQDFVLAYVWYSLAVSRYSALDKQLEKAPESDYRRDSMRQRDELAAKMTPAQIAEAQKLARERNPKTKRP